MKTLAILIMHLIGLSSPVSINAQDIEGTWSAKVNTVDGQVEIFYQFETEGDTLSGSVFTPEGVYRITQGSVNGNTISFVIMFANARVFYTGYYLREQLLISASYQGNSGQLALNRVEEEN